MGSLCSRALRLRITTVGCWRSGPLDLEERFALGKNISLILDAMMHLRPSSQAVDQAVHLSINSFGSFSYFFSFLFFEQVSAFKQFSQRQYFKQTTFSDVYELNKFFFILSAFSFRNILRDTGNSSFHLANKPEIFVGWKVF